MQNVTEGPPSLLLAVALPSTLVLVLLLSVCAAIGIICCILLRRRRSEVTVQQARRIVVSENLVLENQLQLQIYTQNGSSASTTSFESYSGPSIVTQSQPPHSHTTSLYPPTLQRKRCFSNPNRVINRIASKMPDSFSCHDAELYSNIMVVPMNHSQQSSLASHSPTQVASAGSSPSSRRGITISHVSLSGHSTASDPYAYYIQVEKESNV